MEGKRSTPKSTELLQKIRAFTRSILVDLCNGRSPVILINKFRTYCSNSAENCLCSSNLPVGTEVLTLQRQPYAHRIDVQLRVLLIVQQLLQENKHASKRDIYYTYPSLFSDQSVVDRAINDICILLECSRHNLNVVSVAKGLLMGWLRFSEDGNKFDCIASPNTAHTIPVQVEEVQDILSFAEYILVVEKESVFQRLANDKFCSDNRCIVITGRGYPDVPTRRFLRLLCEKLSLPVYCLVDCDPYGFDILATYRFGSLEMAYDAEFLRVPDIFWVGAFTSDTEEYRLPSQCLLPLTIEDMKKIEALLHRCYLQHEELHWRRELEKMQEKGVKFEIEALSVHALSFLSKEYLPPKIQSYVLLNFLANCSELQQKDLMYVPNGPFDELLKHCFSVSQYSLQIGIHIFDISLDQITIDFNNYHGDPVLKNLDYILKINKMAKAKTIEDLIRQVCICDGFFSHLCYTKEDFFQSADTRPLLSLSTSERSKHMLDDTLLTSSIVSYRKVDSLFSLLGIVLSRIIRIYGVINFCAIIYFFSFH